jgi:hypothetical protein
MPRPASLHYLEVLYITVGAVTAKTADAIFAGLANIVPNGIPHLPLAMWLHRPLTLAPPPDKSGDGNHH